MFSHCPICRSLELHWQHAPQLTSVGTSFFAARPKYSAPAVNYVFNSHVRNFTRQFTQYSDARTRIFVISKIYQVSRGFPAKTNSIPAASLQLQFPSPWYSRSICPHSRGFPAESAEIPPSLFRANLYPSPFRGDCTHRSSSFLYSPSGGGCLPKRFKVYTAINCMKCMYSILISYSCLLYNTVSPRTPHCYIYNLYMLIIFGTIIQNVTIIVWLLTSSGTYLPMLIKIGHC